MNELFLLNCLKTWKGRQRMSASKSSAERNLVVLVKPTNADDKRLLEPFAEAAKGAGLNFVYTYPGSLRKELSERADQIFAVVFAGPCDWELVERTLQKFGSGGNLVDEVQISLVTSDLNEISGADEKGINVVVDCSDRRMASALGLYWIGDPGDLSWALGLYSSQKKHKTQDKKN